MMSVRMIIFVNGHSFLYDIFVINYERSTIYMDKHPYANIESWLSYDFTFKVDDDHEYTIPKGVSTKSAEPSIVYATNSIGAWKLNTDPITVDDYYVASFERAARKKTQGLPAPQLSNPSDPNSLPTKLLLVSAEVAAVGRKIEKRKDLITPADLIRARYNDNRYIRFLHDSEVPAT